MLSSVADRRNWHIESVPEGTGVPVACQFSPNDVAGSCGWCRPSATCAGLGTVGCAVVGGLSAVFRQGNKYAYAGDDPINNTDPTGQFSIVGGIAIGLAVTGIAISGVGLLAAAEVVTLGATASLGIVA